MSTAENRCRGAGAACLALVLAACASGGGAGEAFRDGLTALEGTRTEVALRQLERVRRECGTAPLGQQAVLVEAAAALRGGAGARDPQRAAILTAAYLRQPSPPAWGVPIAESLQLMAQELGASPPSREATADILGGDEDAGRARTGCGARWDPARTVTMVPRLEGTGVTAELRQLRTRMAELEEEVERLRALLKVPEDGGG